MRLTVTIDTDIETLDARDRAELEGLLLAALEGPDDEAAWRPLVRARRLLERARIVAEQTR